MIRNVYPESGLFSIPDPGSKGQKSSGSRIPGPDAQHGKKNGFNCWTTFKSFTYWTHWQEGTLKNLPNKQLFCFVFFKTFYNS